MFDTHSSCGSSSCVIMYYQVKTPCFYYRAVPKKSAVLLLLQVLLP